MHMKLAAILFCQLLSLALSAQQMVRISRQQLLDKVKGGWAGQTIGVTYGAPVEFRYNGTMINDYHRLEWNDGLLKSSMTGSPGIYDDLYMDLTFVEVFEREGLDAPVASHAKAFANAGYMLWHANQAARYNILGGMEAPASGHWLNNPHADCIDYQIESDFAGLMSPGMPNTASRISDSIGHIMNHGDGWYGGVYVGAMYALAFTYRDIRKVVTDALLVIPVQSKFRQCISDVIRWHGMYPGDWQRTWFEIQKKWSSDIGCPDGVFSPFNIDAKLNAAYVVTGLLYGNGDFTKTLEIATRCGQDADCNPSTAGGVLGTLIGYDAIPPFWKQGLRDVEDLDFKYTSMSLNKVYETGTRHALRNIERNGGRLAGEDVWIKTQVPVPVRFEESFRGHRPTEKREPGRILENEWSLSFTGKGFVIQGASILKSPENASASGKEAIVEVYLDDKLLETVKLPVSFTTRRHEICWRYGLEDKPHVLRLRLRDPDPSIRVELRGYLIYGTDGS